MDTTSNLKAKTKFGLLFGAGGFMLITTMVGYFVMMYFTDVLGISAAAAGLLILSSRIWDAVNDPMAGVIIDRTNTKDGKARPYIKYGAIFLALFTILLFSSPNFSETGKLIWAYFTYIGYGMSVTIVGLALVTLIPRMSNTVKKKTTLTSFYYIGVSVFSVIASFACMPLVKIFGKGDLGLGFRNTAMLFSFFALVALWFCFANVREIETETKYKEKYSLRVIFSAIIKNKPFLIMAVNGLIMGIGGGIFSASLVYYLRYYMQRPDLISIFMPIFFITTIVASLSSNFVLKRVGKKNSLILGGLITIVFITIRVITKDSNPVFLLILLAIAGLAIGLRNVAVTASLTDTISYGQYKTGVKLESIIMSASTFNSKMGRGIGIGIFGFMLDASGYVPNAAIQTESALKMLFHANVTSFLIAFVLVTILLLFYPLTTKKIKEIEVALSTEDRIDNVK